MMTSCAIVLGAVKQIDLVSLRFNVLLLGIYTKLLTSTNYPSSEIRESESAGGHEKKTRGDQRSRDRRNAGFIVLLRRDWRGDKFKYMLCTSVEEEHMVEKDHMVLEKEESHMEDINAVIPVEGIQEDVIRLRGGGIGTILRSGRTMGNEIVLSRTAFKTGKRSRPYRSNVKQILDNVLEFVDEFSINMPPPPKKIMDLRGGAQSTVLGGSDLKYTSPDIQRQFKFQKLLFTAYTYNMSPVRWFDSANGYWDKWAKGVGPALYWVTDEVLKVGTSPNEKPNPKFGMLREFSLAEPTVDTDPLNGVNGVIYVFVADWFGNAMNPEEATATRMIWDDETIYATTDPNAPIVLSDLVGTTNPNKDWSVIRHYATYIDFIFTNMAPYPYIIEILFFKFKVDVDDMGWTDQCLAPMSNQSEMQSYCENNVKNFGTRQITVVKRHRIRLNGLEKHGFLPSTDGNAGQSLQLADTVMPNVATYSYKVKRKYDICKSIKVGSEGGYTERDFFEKFYQKENGIYCRVQAWPEAPLFTTNPNNSTTNVFYIRCNNGFDNACQVKSNAGVGLDYIKPAVQCIMKKRSYIKVDTPTLKGPFMPV